jgi:site-specific recombinase XerD
MITLNFYQLLSKGNGKDKGPIYLLVKGLDKRLNLSLHIVLNSKDWDKKKERVKQQHPQSFYYNTKITELHNKVWSFIQNQTQMGKNITTQDVKDYLNQKELPKNSILNTCELFIIEHKPSLNNGTIRQYKVLKKKLSNFITTQLHKTDIPLDELNFSFISKFKLHLDQHYKNHPNTIHKQIVRLNTIINWSVKMDLLKENPFKNFKVKTVPTVKRILNHDDIKLIESFESNNITTNIVRDTFLFMCYTGLSYSDLKKLTVNDIQTSINGNKIIKISRKKTNEYCMIPLISKCIDIINRYSSHPKVVNSGFVIPMISNQKTNDHLLIIQNILKISKKMTCHVARHSFATISLELGVPMETVSKLLGHSSIRTTQIYGKITETKLLKDFDLFERGFSNNEPQQLLTKII